MQSEPKSIVRKKCFCTLASFLYEHIYFGFPLFFRCVFFFKDAAGAWGAPVQKLCTYLNKVRRIKGDRIINK